jgi:hypothetical protein
VNTAPLSYDEKRGLCHALNKYGHRIPVANLKNLQRFNTRYALHCMKRWSHDVRHPLQPFGALLLSEINTKAERL